MWPWRGANVHRTCISTGRLPCQNASTAKQSDKKTLCQQANQAWRHLLTSCPQTRKALGKPKILDNHASFQTGLDNVKTNSREDGKLSVKHGMPLQACRNLHLLNNKLRLHSGSIHVAVERCKCAQDMHINRKASMSERLNSKAI